MTILLVIAAVGANLISLSVLAVNLRRFLQREVPRDLSGGVHRDEQDEHH